jgi:hypothetical protein
LKNRRYIWEFSRQIIEHAGKVSGRVTLLVFDIDNLKHYNDVSLNHCGSGRARGFSLRVVPENNGKLIAADPAVSMTLSAGSAAMSLPLFSGTTLSEKPLARPEPQWFRACPPRAPKDARRGLTILKKPSL